MCIDNLMNLELLLAAYELNGRQPAQRPWFDHALLHATRREDQHRQQPGRAQRDELDVPDRRARQGGVLHDRDLLGQLRQQPHRALDHVVEVVGALEEGRDGALLGRGHRLDLGQPVDEEAVALVGGDAPGTGVRLGDQPLLLQRGHVVADGRGRDAEAVALDQRLAPDRLAGGDVVLHDRPEHGEPAVLLHVASSPPA